MNQLSEISRKSNREYYDKMAQAKLSSESYSTPNSTQDSAIFGKSPMQGVFNSSIKWQNSAFDQKGGLRPPKTDKESQLQNKKLI